MEIVVGTYEELLLGFRLEREIDFKYRLEASFTDHSHMGCIRTVAISRQGILASGSSDEMIRIYNLRTRSEMGALAHHEGTITGLSFHGKKHMLSSSEDGSLAVWKIGRWECLRSLRGHKDVVTDFSVHPSGKLALSVSKDKTLRTWNLITGKCAYTSNIKFIAEFLLWSPAGDKYLLINGNTINIYNVETAELMQNIQCGSRICCALFLRDSVLAVGGEGGDIHLFDIDDNKHITKFSTETNRVKGMCVCHYEDQEWLLTVSSDGAVQGWTILEQEGKWETKKQFSHDCSFRPTCVAVFTPSSVIKEHTNEEGITNQQQQEVIAHEESRSVDEDQTSHSKRKIVVEQESDSPDMKKRVKFDSTGNKGEFVKMKKKNKKKNIEISFEKDSDKHKKKKKKSIDKAQKAKKIEPDKKLQLF